MVDYDLSRAEILILRCIKNHGGEIVHDTENGLTVFQIIAKEIDLHRNYVRQCMKGLEEKSLVLRTYKKPPLPFGQASGGNLLIKVELVDKNMELPHIKSIPPRQMLDWENQELEERTEHEPSADAIIMALLARNDEKDAVIAKLQEIVNAQAEEVSKLKKQTTARSVPTHLQSRVRDALSPEQWAAIKH